MKLLYLAGHLTIELNAFTHVTLDNAEIDPLHKFIHKIQKSEATNMKKVKVPKPVPGCEMFDLITNEILDLQKCLEWYNDKMLEQFWRLNTKRGDEHESDL